MRSLALLLLLPVAGAAERAPGERFALQSIEVRTVEAVSRDGRFRVEASASLRPDPAAGGRFQLKSTAVDCVNAPGEVVFADGFE